MGKVRTRVWTAVRDRSGVAGKASGRRRGGRSRAERRTWRADSSVAMLLMEALAIDAQKGGRHGDDLPELRPRHPVIQNGSPRPWRDRKSTRLNSSHMSISYAVFCLKKKKKKKKKRKK